MAYRAVYLCIVQGMKLVVVKRIVNLLRWAIPKCDQHRGRTESCWEDGLVDRDGLRPVPIR